MCWWLFVWPVCFAVYLLQITDTTEYVCSIDWTELDDLPKS